MPKRISSVPASTAHAFLVAVAVLLAVACLPAGALAQTPISGSASLGFRSNYLFAGIPFAADEVTQATVSAGAEGFTAYGYAVYDHDLGEVSELDLYGDYYAQLSPLVGAFVGAAFYSFKILDQWESTPEVYAGLVFTAPLNPTLYVAHDFDLGDGTHATLMLSHSVPLDESGATLGFTGNLDYNDGYYTDISGFSYADIGANLDIPLGPVVVSPLIVLQFGIDDTFVDEEVFGVTVSYGF